MPGSQGGDYLQRRYQDLQHDWESYKRSLPPRPHRRARSIPDLSIVSPDFLSLLHSSPKELLSSLQRTHSPNSGWKPRTGDQAADEVAAERHMAIRSGRLRGRRLLEALECAKEEVGFGGNEERCSICSPVSIQGSVKTSCSCTTSSLGGERYTVGYSSSSSSSLVVEEAGREKILGGAVGEVGGGCVGVGAGGGGKWVVRMFWLGLVLVVLALAVVSLKELGVEEYGEYVTPT